MKFKQFLTAIADPNGFFPAPQLRYIIRTNTRRTAREEAIAAKIIEQANPHENITGHFGWGPEQQLVLQQLWLNKDSGKYEWRDVPIADADKLFSTVDTQYGELPIPNAVREPGVVQADFSERLRELTGEDF
jgi:hypothetical protein